MSVARIAKYGTKAVYGISKKLASKPFASLTASQYCKVAKGSVDSNPIAKGMIDEFCKSGKHFEKLNKDTIKWAKKTYKELGILAPIPGQMFKKGKLTQAGKKMFQDELAKRGLPKTATVMDVLNYDAWHSFGNDRFMLNSWGNGGFGCFA